MQQDPLATGQAPATEACHRGQEVSSVLGLPATPQEGPSIPALPGEQCSSDWHSRSFAIMVDFSRLKIIVLY